jgi:hypothetical protein
MRERIREMLEAGVPMARIAAELGVTPPTISYHARKVGYPAQPRSRYDWAAVQAYCDDGHAYAETKAWQGRPLTLALHHRNGARRQPAREPRAALPELSQPDGELRRAERAPGGLELAPRAGARGGVRRSAGRGAAIPAARPGLSCRTRRIAGLARTGGCHCPAQGSVWDPWQVVIRCRSSHPPGWLTLCRKRVLGLDRMEPFLSFLLLLAAVWFAAKLAKAQAAQAGVPAKLVAVALGLVV